MTEHSICKNCGREYTADKITSAFCTMDCYNEYHKIEFRVKGKYGK